MRKRIYLPVIVLALFLSFNAYSQRYSPFSPEQTDLQKQNLKGPVKSTSNLIYPILRKEGDKYIVSNSDLVFIYMYNQKGNQVQRRTMQSDSIVVSKTIYHFDDQGRPLSYTTHIGGKLWRKEVFQFDKKGNHIGIKNFGKNEQLEYRDVYQLDATGRKKEERTYNSKDSLTGKGLFWYFKEDNISIEKWYGKNGVFRSWYEYTFNDKGLLIQEKEYEEGGGPIGRILFTYDARGNLLERLKSVRNANNTTRYVYTYDENDNITSLKIYDRNEKLLETNTYGYLYDAKGNWIEKLEYVDGVEKKMRKRAIYYY